LGRVAVRLVCDIRTNRSEGTAASVHTYGAGRVNLEAAADLLGGEKLDL